MTTFPDEEQTERHEEAECCSHHHHHHHRPLIPVGQLTVDCTPVTFRTPCQAFNLVTCPVSWEVELPCTETRMVPVPQANGCWVCEPVITPVTTVCTVTENLPPVLTPVPVLHCPCCCA